MFKRKRGGVTPVPCHGFACVKTKDECTLENVLGQFAEMRQRAMQAEEKLHRERALRERAEERMYEACRERQAERRAHTTAMRDLPKGTRDVLVRDLELRAEIKRYEAASAFLELERARYRAPRRRKRDNEEWADRRAESPVERALRESLREANRHGEEMGRRVDELEAVNGLLMNMVNDTLPGMDVRTGEDPGVDLAEASRYVYGVQNE